MTHRQKEGWRKFIEGKIAQEEGREEDGLRAIEVALEIDPTNQHFRAAAEDARRSLSRNLSGPEEALLAHVQKKYAQLVPAAVATEKAARMSDLKELIAELNGHSPYGHARTYKRGLHC